MSVDKNGKTPLNLAEENKHTIILEYEKKHTLTLFAEDQKKDLKQSESYSSSMAA
jgi:hypothetical protein